MWNTFIGVERRLIFSDGNSVREKFGVASRCPAGMTIASDASNTFQNSSANRRSIAPIKPSLRTRNPGSNSMPEHLVDQHKFHQLLHPLDLDHLHSSRLVALADSTYHPAEGRSIVAAAIGLAGSLVEGILAVDRNILVEDMIAFDSSGQELESPLDSEGSMGQHRGGLAEGIAVVGRWAHCICRPS